MTKNDINIKIAKLCGKSVIAFRFKCYDPDRIGWEDSPHYTTYNDANYWREREREWDGEVGEIEEIESSQNIPDYYNNISEVLYAMKYMRDNVLSSYQWEKFGRLLYGSDLYNVIADSGSSGIDYYDLANFIADLTPQRICEALIKVVDNE